MDQITNLSFQFSRNEEEFQQGQIDIKDYNIEQNKIFVSTQKIVSRIREDISKKPGLPPSIQLFEDKEALKNYIDDQLGTDYRVLNEMTGENIDGDRAIMFKVQDLSDSNENTSLKVVKVIKPFSILASENLSELHPDINEIERFSSRTGIITILKQQVSSYPWFFLMPYIKGRTIKECIEGGHKWSMAESLTIIEKLLETALICQQNGHVHGALKPQQIILNEEEGNNPIISPFHFVTQTFFARRTPATILSNCRYLSPEELVDSKVNRRSIQFSIGLIAFELIEGRPFFGGRDAIKVVTNRITYRKDPKKYIQKHLRNPKSPKDLLPILERMLKPNHRDRFRDLRMALMEIKLVGLLENIKARPDSTPVVRASYERCKKNEAFYESFYKEFFDKSAGSISKFKNYPNLKEHFGKVDKTVEEILSILNQNEGKSKDKLKQIALSHANQYKVTAKEFQTFKEVLFEKIQEFDPRWNPEVEQAWEETLDKIFYTIEECTGWINPPALANGS